MTNLLFGQSVIYNGNTYGEGSNIGVSKLQLIGDSDVIGKIVLAAGQGQVQDTLAYFSIGLCIDSETDTVLIGNPTETNTNLSGNLSLSNGAHTLGDAFGNLFPRSLVMDNINLHSDITKNQTLFYQNIYTNTSSNINDISLGGGLQYTNDNGTYIKMLDTNNIQNANLTIRELTVDTLNVNTQNLNSNYQLDNLNFIISGDGISTGMFLFQHDLTQIKFGQQQNNLISVNDIQGDLSILNNINHEGNVITSNISCSKLVFDNSVSQGKISFLTTDIQPVSGISPTYGYSMVLDNDNGFSFSNGNNQQILINTTGMIIGSGTPSNSLDVLGNINTIGQYKINDTILLNYYSLQFQPNLNNYIDFKITGSSNSYDGKILYDTNGISFYGNYNRSDMIIQSDLGFVGIGTQTPNSILNVSSDQDTYLTLQTTTNSNYSGILLDTQGTSIMISAGSSNSSIFPMGLCIMDIIQGTTRMIMNSNGDFIFGSNQHIVTQNVNYDFFGTLQATLFQGDAQNTSNTITTYTNNILTQNGGREIDIIQGKNIIISSTGQSQKTSYIVTNIPYLNIYQFHLTQQSQQIINTDGYVNMLLLFDDNNIYQSSLINDISWIYDPLTGELVTNFQNSVQLQVNLFISEQPIQCRLVYNGLTVLYETNILQDFTEHLSFNYIFETISNGMYELQIKIKDQQGNKTVNAFLEKGSTIQFKRLSE